MFFFDIQKLFLKNFPKLEKEKIKKMKYIVEELLFIHAIKNCMNNFNDLLIIVMEMGQQPMLRVYSLQIRKNLKTLWQAV